MSKKMILGATAAIISFGALTAPSAYAHSKHKVYRPYIYLSTYDDSCSFYRWKWRKTGSHFWKSKYYHCRGIW